MTKKGVYFAFRDQGACISLLAVKVYYITCPAVTENFAHFNETPTGREITIIEKQTGVCVQNAEASEPPTYLCKGDGKWTILTGGCKCKVGYEPDEEKQTCTGKWMALTRHFSTMFITFTLDLNCSFYSPFLLLFTIPVCPAGTFRSNEVTKCAPCPLNSKSVKLGSAYCSCIDGYYRHPRDGRQMPCYRPPGKPTNLTLLFMDQTSAILSWNVPKRPANEYYDSKYRSDIIFKVKCIGCNTNALFNPATETFNETKLAISNLEPVTTYTVQIHSLNSVSYLINADDALDTNNNSTLADSMNNLILLTSTLPLNADEPQMTTEYAEIIFTTESAIQSAVTNTRIVSITSKEIDLTWDKPLHSDVPIESYEVRWFPKSEVDAVNKSTISTQELRAHIENLMENTEYGFQVRCKTTNGYGTYSNIVYGQTHQSVSPGKNKMHCSHSRIAQMNQFS